MTKDGKARGGTTGKAKAGGSRGMTVRVKTAKGRKISSTQWLKRQLNDPYVAEARRLGYRSRAAFKLIELDDRFHFLRRGQRIVDLGAAPGGWTQVAAARSGADAGAAGARVVGIDRLEMDAIAGADLLHLDFMTPEAPDALKAALGGPADVVLSDMAASSSGHPQTDHLRIVALLEAALEFAGQVLAPGGAFVGKVLQGGTEHTVLAAMKRDFAQVRHAKPPSSRKESAELYVVATGFRGARESG